MKSYIQSQKSVKISEIESKENSLSAFSFKIVPLKNTNFLLLKDLLSKNKKGFEPGSNQYISFTNNFFIRISELDDLDFTFTTSKDTKKIIPLKKDKVKIKKGDICYQTASNVGNVCIYCGKPAYFNSHIRKLTFKKNKFYIYALLKSNFCKNQVDVGGSIKGVDNFREEYLLNTKIPFPTRNNHSEPEKIEELISLIVQNIIDKEEQIKEKNKLNDDKIEKELKNNQKLNKFSYSYPKISEIKKEGRLDTGLYEREFKKIDFIIKNYKESFFQIPIDKFKSGSTPKIRVFNPSNKKYKWLTPTHITDEGFYEPNLTINMPTKNNVNKDCLLIINRTSKGKKGEFVGISCFYDFSIYGKGQHNQGLYQISDFDKQKSLFLVSLLNSKIFRQICGCVTIGSKMKEMKSYDFSKLIFPNFPESKQKEISKNYYNKVERNKELLFENYLNKETLRNNQLGIFQLNMELLKLREILENLIHKIVMEERIDINLKY